MADRPLLITIIAVLAIIVGILTIMGGLLMVAADEVLDGMVDLDLSWIHALGYISIVLGLLALIVGYSLWKGWTIAWYLSLIYFAVNGILSLVNIVLGSYSDILSLVIAVVVIYYLFRPHVKSFFKV